MSKVINRINLSEIDNLYHLFCTRVRLNPDKTAYQYCDGESPERVSISWSEMANHVANWQAAFKTEKFKPWRSSCINGK